MATVLEAALAALLLFSAMSKVIDWHAWRTSLVNYRIRALQAGPVRFGVPVLEAALGVALAFGSPVAPAAASLLFMTFAVILAVAIRRGGSGGCACFGAVARTRIGPVAVGRALLLAGACMVVGLASAPPPAYQPVAALVLMLAILIVGELRRPSS